MAPAAVAPPLQKRRSPDRSIALIVRGAAALHSPTGLQRLAPRRGDRKAAFRITATLKERPHNPGGPSRR